MKTFRETFILVFVLIAIGSCTPKISSQSRPWYCAKLPTEPRPSGTLTPTPNRLTQAPNPTRPALPTRQYKHVYDLSPKLPIEEESEIIVFRCNGTYDLYRLGPEINPDRDIVLKKGDIIISSSPPAVLMGHQPPPTATPTATPPLPTASMTASITPTNSPSGTPYIENYPIKTVWVQYGYTTWGHADWEFAFPDYMPSLILYTDGTMIVYRNQKLYSKYLSKDEICGFFTWVESLGFFDIPTNGSDYENDPIYENVPAELLHTDDMYEYLVVNGNRPKSLWVYEPIKDYADQRVMEIMRSLRNYAPSDLQVYQPDRLGLYVERGKIFPELDNLEPIPWPLFAPPITARNENKALYLDGETATGTVYSFFNKPFTWRVFTFDGREYSVIARPLLPHERRTNDGVEIQPTSQFEPPFTCDTDPKSFENP